MPRGERAEAVGREAETTASLDTGEPRPNRASRCDRSLSLVRNSFTMPATIARSPPRLNRPSWRGMSSDRSIGRGRIDRLQERRRPHAVSPVPGHVDRLLQGEGPLQHQRRERHEQGDADRVSGGVLHVAEPDRLGQGQALRAEGLLRHLQAVERGVVQVEAVVERHLLLEDLPAVGEHPGDRLTPLGLEPLHAERPDVVQDPDGERLSGRRPAWCSRRRPACRPRWRRSPCGRTDCRWRRRGTG